MKKKKRIVTIILWLAALAVLFIWLSLIHIFGDIGLTLAQLGIMAFVLVHDRIHDLIEERTVDAKQLAMAGRTSQQAAQHVAAALVAGQHAVADQIRFYRRQEGLTQEQLAEAMGVSVAAVSKWEQGVSHS